MGGGGGWGGGEWGGEDSFSLVFENSIVLIKCTLYDTVFQRQVSICRGVVFSYSFSIYCAAYHGIWCSVTNLCLSSFAKSHQMQQKSFDVSPLDPQIFFPIGVFPQDLPEISEMSKPILDEYIIQSCS